MYEGRYDEAIAIPPAAAKRDQDQGNSVGAAAKLVALAEASQARGNDAARQAIAQAGALSTQENVLVPAARLDVAAGRPEEARKIAAVIGQRLSTQSRAYAKMIEGEIAIAARQYVVAIDALNAAQKPADLWLVGFAMGIAYFQDGHFPEAVSEFEKCRERRGEATSVFLDDLPTIRYYHGPLLAGSRAGDAEARRAPAVSGVPAHPTGGEQRPSCRGRAAPPENWVSDRCARLLRSRPVFQPAS